MVGALREALGPSVDLYIDCNGIFNNVGNAIRAAKAVEQFNISFFEEPVPHENTDAMAHVRRKIDIPVAAGERLFTIYRFRELLERGGADVVQPDMSHCGGMLEARKIAAIADAHYAAFAPHNATGEVSYAAAMQLAACVPNFLVLEHFPPEPWRFEVCRNPMQVEDGWLQIPDRPGLGVEFDETAALSTPLRAGRPLRPAPAGAPAQVPAVYRPPALSRRRLEGELRARSNRAVSTQRSDQWIRAPITPSALPSRMPR